MHSAFETLEDELGANRLRLSRRNRLVRVANRFDMVNVRTSSCCRGNRSRSTDRGTRSRDKSRSKVREASGGVQVSSGEAYCSPLSCRSSTQCGDDHCFRRHRRGDRRAKSHYHSRKTSKRPAVVVSHLDDDRSCSRIRVTCCRGSRRVHIDGLNGRPFEVADAESVAVRAVHDEVAVQKDWRDVHRVDFTTTGPVTICYRFIQLSLAIQ